MNNNNHEPQSNERIAHILSTLSTYRKLWIAPMVLGVVLSAAYVLVLRQETWSAKQALIVRDDLLGQSFKPGRFDSIESMKSAQETILEIARKPQVIRNALEKLGPVSKGFFGMGLRGWPSEETIEDVQGSITFSAPNGAEFGKTEVIVLNTKASTRDRSREFIELLLNEIILKVDEVRSLRLQSMEVELLQARNAALLDLEESKARLREMDQKLGVDVGAMSALNDAQSSDNTIKRDISQIRLEKRQVETNLESLRRSLAMLAMAKENPDQILNISGDLGKSQPTLDALKKEVVKTQKDLAIMAGKYNSIHPDVINAKNAIQAMQQQIYLELDSSMRGLQNDIAVADKKLERLNYEMENLDGRLISLSSKRADSLTLIADLKTRTEIANKAQSDLSEIQGLSLARNADLLTRVDEPQVSTKPDGLGKTASILAGGFGGLMLGLGLVMLVAPPIGSDEDASLDGRAGSLDRFFDSKAFEKAVVNASSSASTAAAAAAAAAVQSASKAKDYFMSSRTDRGETTSEDNQTQPASNADETLDPTSAHQSVPVEITGVLTPAESISSPEPTVTDNSRQTQPRDVPASLQSARGITIKPKKTVESQPVEPSSDESAPVATSTVEPANVEVAMDAKSIEDMAASQLAALQVTAMKSKPAEQPVVEPPASEPSVVEPPVVEPPVVEPPVVEPPVVETPVSMVDRAFEVEIEETSSATSDIQEWVTINPVPAEQEELDQPAAEPQELDQPAADHEETPAMIVVSQVDETAAPSNEAQEPIPEAVASQSESDTDDQPVRQREEAETIQIDSIAEVTHPDPNVHSDADEQPSDTDQQPIRQREEAETIQIEPMAELMRRDPNVRPVDLAKSVEMEAAFVRIVPKKKESGDNGQDNPQANAPRQENPFLRDKSGPQPEAEGLSEGTVPEQIKKLNESISRFTRKRPKKGPADE